MPENIRKPKILLKDFERKRRHTSKCVRELIEYARKLDEDIDFDLNYVEIDSDQESGDVKNVSTENDNSESEDFPGPAITGKVKSKSGNKKSKKKIRSPISAGRENEEAKKEMKTKKETDGERSKNKAKKGAKIVKPKSRKESFKVEDVKKGSESLIITPNKKRKSSNCWIVDDLDKREDNKMVAPRIIKIETKTGTILADEIRKESVKSEECDKPVKNETPQLKLSAAFWDRAKEKIFRNEKNPLPVPNPAFFDQPKNPRRISFALDRNEAKGNEEYINEVRNSPSIPFDGSRRPVQSALKSGLHPSPVNPFYKFNEFN